jgi:hypothetical protein
VSWLKRLGTILLLAGIAIAIRQAWHHSEVTEKQHVVLDELDRTEPGWRLEDIEAAREKIPEQENSARIVIAASSLLPQPWPSHDLPDLFAHTAPQEQLAPDDFARLNQELEKVRPALETARKLTKMPRGRHHIIYERNTLETRLNEQGETRRIAILLAYDALRYDQIGDGKSALTSCGAALNAARSLGDEPITLSQLIRSACVLIACQAIERTLAQTEPPPDELLALQRALEVEDAHPGLLIIMRGERAMCNALFEAVENGDVSLNGLAGVRWSWLDYAFVSIGRMDTHEDHVLMLSLMARAITAAQLPMHEQIEAERKLDQEIRAVRGLSRPPILTGLLMSPMTKQGEASRRKHAYIRCTIVALACERFRRDHGGWPASIDKLCPKYLDALPLDPFDGRPLRYRRLDDGIVIYSISSDGVDNGGNLDRERTNQPGVDIGFRLWDVARRRQPPQPKQQQPAVPPGMQQPPPNPK